MNKETTTKEALTDTKPILTHLMNNQRSLVIMTSEFATITMTYMSHG
ncbi:MAG: hypothetical protein WAT92_12490 [Saprospiraceae bacterium]